MGMASREKLEGTAVDAVSRLIEFDLPIQTLSKLKSKRTQKCDVDVRSAGIWWSRKPQHQCRAIWLATLFPNPFDDQLARESKTQLIELLDRHGLIGNEKTDQELYNALLDVCELLADPSAITKASNVAILQDLASSLDFKNIVAFDPFSGSGAIPIEAARIGLNVIAGEYNPMACLNLKFLMEDWGKV